jgi:hypothetical protein
MADGSDIDRQSVDILCQLLDIESLDGLVTSLLQRSRFSRGSFESHEFGRREHSTASGAAVLLGISGITAISDGVIEPLVEAISDLIADDGRVRGHDHDPAGPDTSWRTAQVLLGLLTRPALTGSFKRKTLALASQLVKTQHSASGGWSLRHGEDPQLLFGFYPTIACAKARKLGALDEAGGSTVLDRASTYLARQVRDDIGSLEEQVLAVHALQVIRPLWQPLNQVVPDIDDLRESVRQRAWTPSRGLTLVDRPVVVYRQPIWHAIIWRPLLYLTLRGASPSNPLQALLGHELVSSFDSRVKAWHGPTAASASPQGVSWASTLALRAAYVLARDLVQHGLTADEWLRRSRELVAAQHEFDVVISFSGHDRAVAEQISNELKLAGFRVFYDRDYQHALLGVDLSEYLQETYFRRSRFAVVIISAAFRESRWAGQWEWKAVLARMHEQRGAYLLPYVIEDIEMPGLNKTLGYASHVDYSPSEFAKLVIRKLREPG